MNLYSFPTLKYIVKNAMPNFILLLKYIMNMNTNQIIQCWGIVITTTSFLHLNLYTNVEHNQDSIAIFLFQKSK